MPNGRGMDRLSLVLSSSQWIQLFNLDLCEQRGDLSACVYVFQSCFRSDGETYVYV